MNAEEEAVKAVEENVEMNAEEEAVKAEVEAIAAELAAAEADEEKPAEEAEEEPKGQSISSMVDQGHAAQLQEFGFTKIVSEKAIFMTGCKGVEPALDWINSHSEDADFNEELFIVG